MRRLILIITLLTSGCSGLGILRVHDVGPGPNCEAALLRAQANKEELDFRAKQIEVLETQAALMHKSVVAVLEHLEKLNKALTLLEVELVRRQCDAPSCYPLIKMPKLPRPPKQLPKKTLPPTPTPASPK